LLEITMSAPPPNPVERQKFAEALQKAVAEVGISQRELARRLEVSQASVSQWLHGQTTPRPSMAVRLERELGRDPGSLLVPLGYVVVDPKGKPLGVPDAIANDPLLGPREREVLQEVYRALVNQRGREPRQIEPDDQDLGPEIDL
jgi:transcriptional regulator with XRE-family HTH domain